MLVRYKGQKAKMPVVVPVGLKSKGAMRLAKVVWLAPIAELPDVEAIKLCSLDPNNFEIVEAADLPVDVRAHHEPSDIPSNAHEPVEAEGTELDADPVAKPKPKRGRRTKAQMAALARAKENHA